jgi:hypothetical protein
MTLTVRTDIEQVGGKQKLFENLVMTEAAAFKFHQLFKALGLEDGIEFPTPESMIEATLNQALRVKVAHRMYEGENQATVKAYLPSMFGGVSAGGATQSAFGGTLNISEDDLPF